MGIKKKLVNNTGIPDYAIERFTRCIYDDVRTFFATEEGQREYAAWEAEQAELNRTKKRAASTAALSVYWGFFFRGPPRFGCCQYRGTIGEILLLVTGEINK